MLFSDLEGYTTLSELLKPDELVTVLNEYILISKMRRFMELARAGDKELSCFICSWTDSIVCSTFIFSKVMPRIMAKTNAMAY